MADVLEAARAVINDPRTMRRLQFAVAALDAVPVEEE